MAEQFTIRTDLDPESNDPDMKRAVLQNKIFIALNEFMEKTGVSKDDIDTCTRLNLMDTPRILKTAVTLDLLKLIPAHCYEEGYYEPLKKMAKDSSEKVHQFLSSIHEEFHVRYQGPGAFYSNAAENMIDLQNAAHKVYTEWLQKHYGRFQDSNFIIKDSTDAYAHDKEIILRNFSKDDNHKPDPSRNQGNMLETYAKGKPMVAPEDFQHFVFNHEGYYIHGNYSNPVFFLNALLHGIHEAYSSKQTKTCGEEEFKKHLHKYADDISLAFHGLIKSYGLQSKPNAVSTDSYGFSLAEGKPVKLPSLVPVNDAIGIDELLGKPSGWDPMAPVKKRPAENNGHSNTPKKSPNRKPKTDDSAQRSAAAEAKLDRDISDIVAKETAAARAKETAHEAEVAKARIAVLPEKHEKILKHMEETSQSTYRQEQVKLLTHAVRTLASQLDVRDDSTLEKAELPMAELADTSGRVGMHRQLANILLSKNTITAAFDALEGKESSSGPTPARVRANADYLAKSESADRFLRKLSLEIPGLIFLLQAATINNGNLKAASGKIWRQFGTRKAQEIITQQPEFFDAECLALLDRAQARGNSAGRS